MKLKRYKSIFKESIEPDYFEKYKSENNDLQYLIDLHNDILKYIRTNESQLTFNEHIQKFLLNKLKIFINTFDKSYEKIIKDFNIKNYLSIKDKFKKHIIFNKRYLDSLSEVFLTTYVEAATSNLHNLIKDLIIAEKENKKYESIYKEEDYKQINVGDTVKGGKWKNKSMEIKSFDVDENGQPVMKTNKGEKKVYSVRIPVEDENTNN
jgi:hypothetical protein